MSESDHHVRWYLPQPLPCIRVRAVARAVVPRRLHRRRPAVDALAGLRGAVGPGAAALPVHAAAARRPPAPVPAAAAGGGEEEEEEGGGYWFERQLAAKQPFRQTVAKL